MSQALPRRAALFSLVLLELAAPAGARSVTIRVDPEVPGPALSPALYGIFIEEINRGVDGGLYAELVRNRGFEDAREPEGFMPVGGRYLDAGGFDSGFDTSAGDLPHWRLEVEDGASAVARRDPAAGPFAAGPSACRVDVVALGRGTVELDNDGYFGIPLIEGARYRLALHARGVGGARSLAVLLASAGGEPASEVFRLQPPADSWQRFEAVLTATRTDPAGRLRISFLSAGSVLLDFVSLFPEDTYRGRKNGLRKDVVAMLADLEPAFVRFPGGCVVEGGSLETRYDWRHAIGPVEQRPEVFGAWGCRRTHGLGFLEYFQLCEDLGAAPLYVAFAGQTCLYRHAELVPLPALPRLATGILDALEYAAGGKETPLGRLRAEHGRLEPFPLPLLEIGNENAGPEYEERYALLEDAVRGVYPELTTIADVRMANRALSWVDDHFYNSPEWFLAHADHYDSADRSGPKVYVGEYAVTSGCGTGNLVAALAEAAFALGFERNGDVVRMASYAPLLANVNGRHWNPNLIQFDGTRVYGTPSYYVQQLLAAHRPDTALRTDVAIATAAAPPLRGRVGVGTWDTQAEFRDLIVERGGTVAARAEAPRSVDFARGAPPAAELPWLGAADWSDFTMRVRAKKTGGAEGFLVVFADDGTERCWWNVGGWGNREHGIERNRGPVGARVSGAIETGRWYELAVKVSGRRVQCFLDGALVHDVELALPRTLFALGGRTASGELIVKIVNCGGAPVAAELELPGAVDTERARLTVLTSESPSDENSLDAPRRVAPIERTTEVRRERAALALPAWSFSVLRGVALQAVQK